MNVRLLAHERLPDGLFDHPLPVDRVLYEAEQVIVYLTHTRRGQPMLAFLASETVSHQFVVVAPVTPSTTVRLENGGLGIREALTGTWMLIVRTDFSARRADVWRVTAADIPTEHLPRPGTVLKTDPNPDLARRVHGHGDPAPSRLVHKHA